jgi:hypothetical protein
LKRQGSASQHFKKGPPDDTLYYGERGGYIQNKAKTMITTVKQGIEKQNELKKGSGPHTLPPKEPGIRSTPNN